MLGKITPRSLHFPYSAQTFSSAKVTEVTIRRAVRDHTWSWSSRPAATTRRPRARALATLCETYWYPLYAYVRRRGTSADDARDLTQGFFTSLLERRDFEHLRQERGRFRAFLLASLQHFLANDAARRRTQKRGGGMTFLPLAFDEAEGRYRIEPAESARRKRFLNAVGR
jgi:RNA polymerase sigma-70 factor (ECF subfamily)